MQPALSLLLGSRSWESFWTIVETFPVLLEDPRADAIALARVDPSASATNPQAEATVVGLLQLCRRIGTDRALQVHATVAVYLGAETWEEACAVLGSAPVLLSDDAEQFLAAATAMTDDSAEGRKHAELLREHVLLIRRARDVGTARAAAEVRARVAGGLDGLPLSTNVVAAVIDAFDAAPAAEVADRARRALDAVPLACIRLRAQLFERLGDAFYVQGQGTRDESLRAAAEAYRAPLDNRLRNGAPLMWAQIMVKWADVEAMVEPGPRVERVQQLNWVCELYEETLEVLTREAYPQQWAAVRRRQGEALLSAGALDRAVASLRDALGVLDPDEQSTDWSNAQLALGRALLARALDPGVLRQLAVDWSGIYASLDLPEEAAAGGGEDESDAPGPRGPDWDLRGAVEALQAASMVCTLEADPGGFARIQELLGMAHWELSETHHESGSRQAAIRAWLASAEVVTPEVDWAWNYRIQRNLRRAGEEPSGQEHEGALSDQALAKALDEGLELTLRRIEGAERALAEDRPEDAVAAFKSAMDLLLDIFLDIVNSGSETLYHESLRLRSRCLQGEVLAYRALGDTERAAGAAGRAASAMSDADESPEAVAAQLATAGRLFLELRDWEPARQALTDALAAYESAGDEAEVAAVSLDLQRIELESTTPLGRLGDSFEAGELSEDDYRYVVALQLEVVRKSSARERRPLLAQGIWRFGKPFCDSFARLPDPSGGVLLPMMEAFELLMGWVNGAVLTDRADEPSRRASAAAQLIRDRARGDDECHGELERGAAWAILSLPAEHPARDQDAAVDMLIEHLTEHGPHEEYEWLCTAAMLLGPGLLSDMDADDLLAKTLGTLGEPLPADKPGRGSGGLSLAEYTQATRVWAGLAALEYLTSREERAARLGDVWDVIRARTRAEAILRLTVPEPAMAREVVLQVRDALGEAAAPGATIGQAMVAAVHWLVLRERWADASDLCGSLGPALEDEQLRASVEACRARALLGLERPREAAELLRSVLPVLQDGYLAAVTPAEIAARGAALSAAADDLVVAHVRWGDWAAGLAASDQARSLRARYSAALRRSEDGPRLLNLERELYQASRGVPGAPATEADFTGDRLAHAVPAAQQLLEKVRRSRPRLTGGLLDCPDAAELARCCEPGEGVLLLALTDHGTFVGLVTPDSATGLAESAELPEWTVRRWSQVLESPGGWLSAMADPSMSRALPAVLDGALAVVDAVLGAMLGSWLPRHRLTRLVIVASRQLQLVPLWALPAVASLPVVVSPSAAQFVASRRNDREPADDALGGSVLAVEDPSGDLTLASVESESIRAALAEWGGSQVVTLTAGATESDIDAALRRARVFHFSGHGRAVASHPDRSALLVAAPPEDKVDLAALAARADEWHESPGAVRWTDVSDPGEGMHSHGRLYERLSTRSGLAVERWLEAGPTSTLWQSAAPGATVCELWSAGDIQLSRVFERCWLATLSACESGNTGLARQIDEFGGLPAAVQLAGARTVVAALWPVSEPVTSLFMRHFYAELTRGSGSTDVAGCVRAAATHLRTLTAEQAREEFDVLARQTRSDSAAFEMEAFAAQLGEAPPFADPWFWAPFFVTGDGRLPGAVTS